MSEEQTAEVIEEELDTQDEAGETEDKIVTLEDEEPEGHGSEGEDGEGEKEGEQTAESGEIEVVLDDEEDSQPSKKTKSVQHRINKLNARNAESAKDAESARSDSSAKDEEIKILKMRIAQTEGQAAPVQPNPDDFDGGTQDPQYKVQQDAYLDFIVDKRVDARFAKQDQTTVAKTTNASNTVALESAAQEHWKRADKLGASDYEATEDKAHGYLGDDLYHNIIMNVEGSELLLYRYGKDKTMADEAVAEVKKNPVRGLAKIAALGVRLKVRPTKTKSTPNPDEPLEGGKSAKKGEQGPPGATYE